MSISDHDFNILLNGFIDEEYLLKESGAVELGTVLEFRLRVDSSNQSLSHISDLLPNIRTYILDGSKIASIRDLGSGYRNLIHLSLCDCELNDIDGIGVLIGLKELYLRGNFISDISPLAMHENIEVLDITSNRIADFAIADTLSSCPNLHYLSLRNNLIEKAPSYRLILSYLIPGLRELDSVPVDPDVAHNCVTHGMILESASFMSELQEELEDEMRIEALIVDANLVSKDMSAAEKVHGINNLDTGSSLTHGKSSVVMAGNVATAMRRRRVAGESGGSYRDGEEKQESALDVLNYALRKSAYADTRINSPGNPSASRPCISAAPFYCEGDITESVISGFKSLGLEQYDSPDGDSPTTSLDGAVTGGLSARPSVSRGSHRPAAATKPVPSSLSTSSTAITRSSRDPSRPGTGSSFDPDPPKSSGHGSGMSVSGDMKWEYDAVHRGQSPRFFQADVISGQSSKSCLDRRDNVSDTKISSEIEGENRDEDTGSVRRRERERHQLNSSRPQTTESSGPCEWSSSGKPVGAVKDMPFFVSANRGGSITVDLGDGCDGTEDRWNRLQRRLSSSRVDVRQREEEERRGRTGSSASWARQSNRSVAPAVNYRGSSDDDDTFEHPANSTRPVYSVRQLDTTAAPRSPLNTSVSSLHLHKSHTSSSIVHLDIVRRRIEDDVERVDGDDDDEDGIAISHAARHRMMSASSGKRRAHSNSLAGSDQNHDTTITDEDATNAAINWNGFAPVATTTADAAAPVSTASAAASLFHFRGIGGRNASSLSSPKSPGSSSSSGRASSASLSSVSSVAGMNLGFDLKGSLAAIDQWVDAMDSGDEDSDVDTGAVSACARVGDVARERRIGVANTGRDDSREKSVMSEGDSTRPPMPLQKKLEDSPSKVLSRNHILSMCDSRESLDQDADEEKAGVDHSNREEDEDSDVGRDPGFFPLPCATSVSQSRARNRIIAPAAALVSRAYNDNDYTAETDADTDYFNQLRMELMINEGEESAAKVSSHRSGISSPLGKDRSALSLPSQPCFHASSTLSQKSSNTMKLRSVHGGSTDLQQLAASLPSSFFDSNKGKKRLAQTTVSNSVGSLSIHPVSTSNSSENGVFGEGVFMNDEDIIKLLRLPPRATQALRTRSSYQEFFKGIRATRMRSLLEKAFAMNDDESRKDEERNKVEKRMELLRDILT